MPSNAEMEAGADLDLDIGTRDMVAESVLQAWDLHRAHEDAEPASGIVPPDRNLPVAPPAGVAVRIAGRVYH